jgi:DNA invertase Pin-like site-specific DNA recombinase
MAQTTPRASGSIRFPAHRLLVTLDFCAALARGEPGREPSRRSLRRNFPIDRFAAQDREGDARHLVGKRHGDKLERLLLDQPLRPHPQRVRVRLAVKQHGMRPDDEQFVQVTIAHLRDAPQPLLAARRVLLGSQPEKGGELARAGEAGRIRYDDGGYSGSSMERPAPKRLLDDVRAQPIDVIVVYKVDRLTRSLAHFAKLVEMFDTHHLSFVSVNQAFNTTTSMGRLTLNVLLFFAQFEREATGERIRDNIAASNKKGIWMGGVVPLSYRVMNRALHVVQEHAAFVRGLLQASFLTIAATG